MLQPQVQDGCDLNVIERLRQLQETAVEEVLGQVRFIGPERKLQEITNRSYDDAQQEQARQCAGSAPA